MGYSDIFLKGYVSHVSVIVVSPPPPPHLRPWVHHPQQQFQQLLQPNVKTKLWRSKSLTIWKLIVPNWKHSSINGHVTKKQLHHYVQNHVACAEMIPKEHWSQIMIMSTIVIMEEIHLISKEELLQKGEGTHNSWAVEVDKIMAVEIPMGYSASMLRCGGPMLCTAHTFPIIKMGMVHWEETTRKIEWNKCQGFVMNTSTI